MKQPENYNVYNVKFGGFDSYNVQAKNMADAEPTSCNVVADWVFK